MRHHFFKIVTSNKLLPFPSNKCLSNDITSFREYYTVCIITEVNVLKA